MNKKNNTDIHSCGSSARSSSTNLIFNVNNHRKSDSVFGTLKTTLKSYKCIPEAKHNKQTTHKTTKTLHISKSLKLQNSKIKNSKIPKFQKSKLPKIQKMQDSVDVKSFGFLDF